MTALQVPLPLEDLDGADAWRLDDRTREAGRRGLAQARAALAAAGQRAARREADQGIRTAA